MVIGICDDLEEYCNAIKCYSQNYFKIKQIEFELYVYSCGKALLNAEKRFDILFLDIELEDSNGIDIAKQILDKAPGTIIVIVTNYRKYLDASMDMHALRFMDKPITQDRVDAVLDRAVAEINDGYITVITQANEFKKIKKADIIYAEVYRKNTTLHTKNEVIVSKKPISYFRERLNASYFAIPHNSFIVNLNFVRSCQRERIELDCGETVKTVYVASRKQPDFKKKFMSFIGEQ